MAIRYSGPLEIRMRLNPNNTYSVTIRDTGSKRVQGSVIWRGIVLAPQSGFKSRGGSRRHALDSRLAFNRTAASALSFAYDRNKDIGVIAEHFPEGAGWRIRSVPYRKRYRETRPIKDPTSIDRIIRLTRSYHRALRSKNPQSIRETREVLQDALLEKYPEFQNKVYNADLAANGSKDYFGPRPRGNAPPTVLFSLRNAIRSERTKRRSDGSMQYNPFIMWDGSRQPGFEVIYQGQKQHHADRDARRRRHVKSRSR